MAATADTQMLYSGLSGKFSNDPLRPRLLESFNTAEAITRMSEADILVQISLGLDAWSTAFQWWSGVSFGVIAVAYFAKKELNLPFVILIALVYISFSINQFSFILQQLGTIGGAVAELEALQAAGNLSAIGVARVADAPLLNLHWFTYPVMFFWLFFGSLFYLAYVYIKAVKESKSRESDLSK